jgi:tRNA threonylcarbamoyladenosine biosynthesis protein TsaE
MPVFDSRNVADTEAIAAGFARSLAPGACVALHGDLGAGKTQFVRGVVAALGGDGRQVSSPTYVLLHVYDAPAMRVYHLDAYRVHGADDFEQIGFVELLDQGGVVIVEWASRVAELLPVDCRVVRIESTSETERRITVDDADHVRSDLPPVPTPGNPGEG